MGHLSTETGVLENDLPIDRVLYRVGVEVHFRNAIFLWNARPFVVDNIESVVVIVRRYAPTRAGTYREQPRLIVLKKGVVNVKNEANRCFGYCIIASSVPQKQSQPKLPESV